MDLGLEALDYDDIVLINAPFTREVHDEAFLERFRTRLAQKDARLEIIWVVTRPEICHERMIARNSDRDTWKLSHWEEYIKTVDFAIPEPFKKAGRRPRSSPVLQFLRRRVRGIHETDSAHFRGDLRGPEK